MTPGTLYIATGCPLAAAVAFAKPLTDAMREFGIDSGLQKAHFIAQAAHESAGFTRLEENLNYTWGRLMVVWPARFPSEAFAKQFHMQPRRIANWVYASRMGNGMPSTDDGWRHIGRGCFQITGKYNYARCSNGIGVDLITNPQLLTDPVIAARSAAWYWSDRNCGAAADVDDVEAVTRLINGGTHGLEDRRALTDLAKLAFRVA